MYFRKPTPMQTLVVREIVQGRTLVTAAEALDIKWDTAKSHMKKMGQRICAANQPHAVYRIHERWPELVADLIPTLTEAPDLDPTQHALLWCMSQGERIECAARRLNITKDTATGRLRKAYRQLEAAHAAQAVHNGLILGVLEPLGEIR